MKKTNRRSFLEKSIAAGGAAAAVTAAAPSAEAKSKSAGAKKKVFWRDGQPPKETPLFSPAVGYGNLLFISGIGAHFEGDITAHTKHVLDEIEKELTRCGSSMEKVLKAQVYLADLKDYDGMNAVFKGRFGSEPPVRTTIAAAGVPGKSLVEIDVIAYI